MSLFEETEKEIIRQNQFRAPPIRKLFSSQTIEESDQDSRQELETFKVFLRIKPIPDYDSQRNTIKIVNSSKLICKPPSTSKHHKAECVEYTFSRIFGAKSTQHDIFNDCVVPCIRDLVNLQNSLIFTYGTTNAGKTYTVQGNQCDPGVIPRTLYSLFTNISPDTKAIYAPYMAKNIMKLGNEKSQEELNLTEEILRAHLNNSKYLKSASCTDVLNYEYRQLIGILDENFIELNANMPPCTIWISFIELYNETILDLLEFSGGTRKPLKLSVDKHNNFYVKGLKHIAVRTFEEAYTIYRIGKKNLSFASTKMNENSSRSHCIFTIKLINHRHKILSNLSICDLAGTERQTKAQNFGMRLKESGIINGSLFQLNRCLRALRDNQTKNTSQLIPYRQSNLTKLFHSALNDKTDEKIVMIVNINPLAELFDETQQVLKMCAIASKIKSKPIMSKILRQSTRFTSYVYGAESSSLLDDDQHYENDFSDCEEDSGEVQCEEIQQLKEQLALKERELTTMKQQYDDCCALYKNSQNMLTEYMTTVENDQKELEESFKRRIELTEKHYERKLEKLKTDSQYLCSDNDLRNEILEKDLLIEELKLQLNNKNDGRQCLNTAKFQEEMCDKIKKIDELNSLLAEGKTAYMTVVDELNSLSQKLSSVENQLQEKTEFAEALEVNLSQKQVTIEDLEARIENLEELLYNNAIEHEVILSNLEKQWNQTKEELSIVQKQLASTVDEKKNLEENKQQLQLEIKSLEEVVNKLMKEIDSMNETASEQKQLLPSLEKERDEAKEESIRLHDEIESLKEKNSNLTKENEKFVNEQAVACAELEKQLSMTKKELITVHQENELLKEEIRLQKEREIIEIEIKEQKRYNTRNNRTPLKELGKENKLTTNKTPNNSSLKSRKAKQKDKLLKIDVLNDSMEPEIFRVREAENANKENTTGRKKKLFSTPISENLISFDSAEKDKGSFLDCNLDDKPKSEVATPAQTVKSVLRKKRLN